MDENQRQEIIDLIFAYGGHKNPKVKQWILNKILETIMDEEEYLEFIASYAEGENGPFTYAWNKGEDPCQIKS